MAGSYKHCVTDAGELRRDSFADMIENLGDAYEAVEEMYGMIWWLASQLSQQLIEEPAHYVERARQEHAEGLTLSPGLEPRK